jgi:Ca-activated chloride channel family protein
LQRIYFILIILALAYPASSQYYIKGDVKDQKNQPLQNVKIYMPSKQSLFYSGVTGGFGIPSSNLYDSLIFSLDGYITQSLKIKADAYQEIILKPLPVIASTYKPKLISLTTGKTGAVLPSGYYQSESYSNLAENDFIKTDNNYSTGFSMRIDKASYSNIRRFINQQMKVPPDAVRIDEMLNYFNFNYKEPWQNNTFRLESQISDCPWNKYHQLLFLNLSAKKLNLDHVPKSNFVFLIDVSGSMDQLNRLPLLKEAFQLLVKNLREKDTVSIVIYGGAVGIWLPPISGNEKAKISKAIEELTAGGDTPGEAAIRTAYMLAKSTFIKNGNNRIILATDGDFNVGQSTEDELEDLIAKEKQSGVYLTCLGVGMGNYKDSKIEILSKKRNGNFAYIDDIREAEKVLVTEFTQTAYSVASDVFLNIQFNPGLIKEYRLIGYDNKKDILAEGGDELEGGEIGSGSGNTVLFELIPVNKDSTGNRNFNIAHVSLHYHLPDDTLQQNIPFNCPANYIPFKHLDSGLRFATAVSMFGLKLRRSKYFPDVDWSVIKNIVLSSLTPGDYLQTEFAGLLDKSKVIYYEKKRKRRRRK